MATDPVLASTVAFLRNHPPFDQMEEGLLGELAADLSMAYFPAGAVVLSPDAGPPPYLYIVQRGLVQLQPAEGYHVSAGSVVTLAPGECFSVYALMEKRAVASPYTAASDTFCYRLPVASFNRLLDRSPRFREFSTDYLRSLLRDSRRLIRMHGASAAAEQQAMNQPLRHLATRAPVCCTGDTPLKTALARMHEARVGSIVVVDDARRPIGIFTRHDVLDRVALAGRLPIVIRPLQVVAHIGIGLIHALQRAFGKARQLVGRQLPNRGVRAHDRPRRPCSTLARRAGCPGT